MKKFLVFLFLFLSCFPSCVNAEVLKASISASEVSEGFMGTWHVTSKLIESTNPSKFNPLSVDIWTLSRIGESLILENPVSGARSTINITEAKDKILRFSRTGYDDGVITVETPTLKLNGNIFFGEDTLTFEQYEGTKLIKKDVVKYKLVGQKIAGENVLE